MEMTMKSKHFHWTAVCLLIAALLCGSCAGPANVSDTSGGKAQSQSEDLPDASYNFQKTAKEEYDKRTFGDKGQKYTRQGYDGWYYLYTEETGKNGVYDISKFQECTYSEEKELWLADVGGQKTEALSAGFHLDMALAFHGGERANVSAILAYKAPEDGGYLLDISYTAGNDDPSRKGNDGVTMSVYGDAQCLYSRNIADCLLEGETIRVKVMLKAGQYCYLIADPNHNGSGDICHSVRVDVTHTLPTTIDNDTVWAFGEGYANGDGSQQGVNQWYYCYTEQTNTDGVYDINRIKECWYKAGKEKDPYTGRAYGNWVAGVFESSVELPSGENHWRLTAEGEISPAVDKAPFASAVLAWKAPADGRYAVDFQLAAGKTGAEPDCDGVTLSIYEGTNRVYSEGIADWSYNRYHVELQLKKDECFYIIVDPNENGQGDYAEGLNMTVKKMTA